MAEVSTISYELFESRT